MSKLTLRLTQEQARQLNDKLVEQLIEYGGASQQLVDLLADAEIEDSED